MLVSRLAAMAVGMVLILFPYNADLSAKRAYGQGSSYQNEKVLANASTVTIMSSSVSSTYTRFAQDIQNVLDDKSENGLRVLPILGSGGGRTSTTCCSSRASIWGLPIRRISTTTN